MSKSDSKQLSALQKLRASQRETLKKYPKSSPKRALLKKNHAAQIEKLKKEQDLLKRARASLPKSKRDKLKPVSKLSPDRIRKETARIKEEGHSLKETSAQIKPPKVGRAITKCFELPRQKKQLITYINRIVDRYQSSLKKKGVADIYGFQVIGRTTDNKIISSSLIYPDTKLNPNTKEEKLLLLLDYMKAANYETGDKKLKLNKICVKISWDWNFLKREVKGWREKI